MTKTEQHKAERAENVKLLRKWLRPGTTVYTVLRSVSRSGMTRGIDLYCVKNGEIRYLSGYAGQILGLRRTDNGLQVGGCGMDMGFHVVYSLSSALYPKGFKLGKGNHGRNGDTSGFDRDGGYALNHRWL